MATEPPHPHDFTVGWICALDVEMAAAAEMLDEEYEDIPVTTTDTNAYIFGRIGKHQVVIGCLAAGRTGLVSAHHVAMQMTRSFSCLRIVLMVGIGGGVPSIENDIRLGDVVVSQPHGELGGVVQYDLGKVTSDRGAIRTGCLNSPPEAILTALTAVKTAQRRNKSRIDLYLGTLIKRLPAYARSEKLVDRLFSANYVHQEQSSCANCSLDKMIPRSDRTKPGPVIHYGTIASGNCVIKDAITRDRLSRDLKGVLGFEMEAAGLMNNFPCVIIRGISDYADSHKNDEWQPYASATAAAFAKELLLHVRTASVEAAKPIVGILEELSEGVAYTMQITQEVQEKVNTAETQKILDWLSPPSINFSRPQNAAKLSRTTGTGEWLFKRNEYLRWISQAGSLIWLRGVSGCGKTVLCSTAVSKIESHCRHDSSRRLAYWFYQFADKSSQSLSNMLRSLIRQLNSDDCFSTTKSLYKRHYQCGSEPSINELLNVLGDMINPSSGIVYIIIDALDECPSSNDLGDRSQLLESLHILHKKHQSLQLLVTSRPEPDIHRIMSISADITLDIEQAIKADVARYVDVELVKPSMTTWSSETISRIRFELLSREERRFRWAELQIRRFRLCPTLKDLDRALATIPKDLESSYQVAFESVPEEYRGHVQKIMSWLAFSYEPLTATQVAAVVNFRSYEHVLEICTSLLVTIIDTGMNDDRITPFLIRNYLMRNSYYTVADIPATLSKYQTGDSGSESEYDTDSPWSLNFDGSLAKEPRDMSQCIIKLAHFSVKEFLISQQQINTLRSWYQLSTEEAHENIAVTAIDALQQGTGLTSLLTYSARYWPAHARQANETDRVQEKIDGLLNFQTPWRYLGWLEMYDPDPSSTSHPRYGELITRNSPKWNRHYHYLLDREEKPQPLYYAALLGLGRSIDVLWQGTNQLQVCEGFYKNALHAAIAEGHCEAMERLIHHCNAFGKYIDLVFIMEVFKTSGKEALRNLLRHWPLEVPITKAAMMRAAYHPTHAELLMGILLDEKAEHIPIPESVLLAAVRCNRGALRPLLRLEPKIAIGENVMLAIIQNRNQEDQVMDLLLNRGLEKMEITESVLVAAAGMWPGIYRMEKLLERNPHDLCITEAILVAAATNWFAGNEIMRLLLKDKPPRNLEITTAVLTAATQSYTGGNDTMKKLLDRSSDTLEIIEAVVLAAAGNWMAGVEIMELLSQRTKKMIITEAIVLTVASNIFQGEKMMRVLLQHGSSTFADRSAFRLAITETRKRKWESIKCLFLDDGVDVEDSTAWMRASRWGDWKL